MVMDPATGDCLALLDGEEITAARTPAATLAAVEALGLRPAVVAILGAGVQGSGHARWFDTRFPGCEIRLWSPSPARARDAVEALRADGVRATAPQSRRATLEGAEVIVTATTSGVPVLDAGDVAAGVLIAGVGSFAPDRREIGSDLLGRARAVVVDDIATAARQSGPLVADGGKLTAGRTFSLGAVLAGAELPAPDADRDLTLFLSVGLGIQDAAIAVPLVELAVRSGAHQIDL
jgi:ornithine cyclodeaminase/alanine dehydrogenase-like protein (mu-crystallin family)